MSNYTYVANRDVNDKTGAISLRDGGLILRLGQYADLTSDEVASLIGRFDLQPGIVGPAAAPGVVDSDPVIRQSTLATSSYSNRLANNSFGSPLSLVAPHVHVVKSGSFTPKSDMVMVDVNVNAAYTEPLGGHVAWFFYYGPVGSQLTPTLWVAGDGQPVPPVVAGAVRENIGATFGYGSGASASMKLTGLTPGTPVAWEVSCIPVGGFLTLPWPSYSGNQPFSIDVSKNVDALVQRWGAVRYSTTGGIQFFVADHWDRYDDSPTGAAIVAAGQQSGFGQVRISPDTKWVVATTTNDNAANRVAIFTTGSDTSSAPAYARSAAGTLAGPVEALTIDPASTYAWVCCPRGASGSGYVQRVKLSDGTLGTALDVGSTVTGDPGANYGHGNIIVSADGSYVYVCCEGMKKVLKINATQPPTIAASTAVMANGPVVCALSPDGTLLYALSRAGSLPKIYEIQTSDMTILNSANLVATALPHSCRMFDDGTELIYASEVVSGSARQIQQINIPALTKVGQFGNVKNGTSTLEPVYDLVTTPEGAIYTTCYTSKMLNLWPGGRIIVGVDDYWANSVRVRATPAS